MTNTPKVRATGRLLASAAVGTLAMGSWSAPAQAQSLQPVVDVCTGLSLDDSVLTGVLNTTVVPTATAVEALFDNLINISVLGQPLLSIPDVDLGVAGTTAALASGQAVSLDVLDSNGNLVSPGNCNLTADGYSLNTQGGIAIGGNAITGLGQDGLAASAGALDAIAFGNGASTAAGAGGAVALGTGASATAANSLALGANSLADRGALAGYTAPGVAGPVSSAGSVSFGSAGAERQLTNIAPGTQASDAATLGQVQGLVAAAATPLALQYDSAALDRATLGGAGGTVIANLAPGTVAAGSTEAVNGGQLFATNQQVAANAGDIAALDAAAVQYDDASRGSIALLGAGGTRVTNVAAGTLSATSSDAVNGAQLAATNFQVAQNTAAIAAINPAAGNAVAYDDATLARATLGGASGTVIGNLADGTVAAGSSEAVNGGQLFATNQQVAANGAAISGLDTRLATAEGGVAANGAAIAGLDTRVGTNTTDIAALQAQVANVPVGYVADSGAPAPSTVPTNTAAFVGAGGGAVRVTGVAAGTLAAGSSDAVNGAQLAATNTAVAANRADIDTNTARIATLNASLAGSTVVAVQYSDPATPTQSNGGTLTNDVTLVGADAAAPVRLHNVAAGTLRNDAANLGQLQDGLAAAVASAQGYTDQRFATLSSGLAQVEFDLDELREDAFSGTASAMALAGIPQTMEPGRSMVGGSIGHYRGRTAFAIGASTSFGDGRGVLKAGGSVDTNGYGGFSAGAGFSF